MFMIAFLALSVVDFQMGDTTTGSGSYLLSAEPAEARPVPVVKPAAMIAAATSAFRIGRSAS
jgi:hypothetical protein